jgi:hypothetical protein
LALIQHNLDHVKILFFILFYMDSNTEQTPAHTYTLFSKNKKKINLDFFKSETSPKVKITSRACNFAHFACNFANFAQLRTLRVKLHQRELKFLFYIFLSLVRLIYSRCVYQRAVKLLTLCVKLLRMNVNECILIFYFIKFTHLGE